VNYDEALSHSTEPDAIGSEGMTASIRASSRKNKIIKTLSVGAYSKVIGVAVTFIMVPLALNYLGADGYGLWMAVSSLIAMLSFVDGGAGNALVNMVSHATGIKSSKSLQTIVSTGFFVLLAIAMFGGLLFSILNPFVPWSWVFGLSDSMNAQALQTLVLIVGIAFFIGMPCSVVGNVQKGFQEGNIEAFWNAKGRILSLVFVYLAIELDAGLLGFAFGFVSGPIVALLLNNFYYFLIKKKEFLPKLSDVRRDEVKLVLSTGGLFFVLQITAAIQSQSDNIIIAKMIGLGAVAEYSVCMQMFLVIPMVMGLLWAPLWPAYREALASGDTVWLKQVFYKSIKLACIVGIPASALLVVFGQEIIRVWVGDAVLPSPLLLAGCGLWVSMLVVGSAMAMLLNGLQVIKIQIMVAVSASILNVCLSIWLISKIGLEGAVYGSVIAYLVCAIIPYYFIIPKLLAEQVMGGEGQ